MSVLLADAVTDIDLTKAGRFPPQFTALIIFSSLKSTRDRHADMDIYIITDANMCGTRQHRI